jgi:lipopolysaccharide/colanic/teichoic acid biosynthesis glycosyltransferase
MQHAVAGFCYDVRLVTPAVRLIKRSFDIVSGAVGLAVAAPIAACVAVAIKLDSPGPLFYKQRRAGMLLDESRPGEPQFAEFNMYKFRTMKVDAEKHTGAVLAQKDDPRITKVGKFLRKSRLDELPQLWHVLAGQMSLIGPRPERPELLRNLAHAIPFFEERMRFVKPGLTGLAQVSLDYAGNPREDSEIIAFREALTNPFKLPEADGSEADGMRMKMLYDLAYGASLEDLTTFAITELTVLAKTPLVMLRGMGT